MKIAMPPAAYAARYFIEMVRTLEGSDMENHKRNRDVEVGEANLILTSPNGTRYSVNVANDGTLSASAV